MEEKEKEREKKKTLVKLKQAAFFKSLRCASFNVNSKLESLFSFFFLFAENLQRSRTKTFLVDQVKNVLQPIHDEE